MATHLVPATHEMTPEECHHHLKRELREILKDPQPLASFDRHMHIRSGRGSVFQCALVFR